MIATETDTPSGSPIARVVVASTAYLAWATVAALIAIARHLPADFGGLSTGLSATNDFLFGFGTALSPPLWWMVVQAIVTLRAAKGLKASRTTIRVLTTFGLVEFVGALGEPITFQVLRPSTFNALLVVVQLGMILLPLAAVVYGLRASARVATGAAALPGAGSR